MFLKAYHSFGTIRRLSGAEEQLSLGSDDVVLGLPLSQQEAMDGREPSEALDVRGSRSRVGGLVHPGLGAGRHLVRV